MRLEPSSAGFGKPGPFGRPDEKMQRIDSEQSVRLSRFVCTSAAGTVTGFATEPDVLKSVARRGNRRTAMDSYVSADAERRRQGQVFGTADELRVLRTLNARANAMRRMAGTRANRRVTKFAGSARSQGSRVA